MNIHIEIAAQTVGEIFGLPITNTLATTWVVMGLLIILALRARRKLALAPGRFQNALEAGFEYLANYMEEVFEKKDLARRFFPLIATLFLFIFLANILEFIPGVGSIGFFGRHNGEEGFAPLFRSVNTDLNVTVALAIISVIVTEVSGIAALGFFRYAGKFLNFASPLAFFIGLIELVSEIARLVSFSFRLFGNIFAGAVLILVVTSFLPVLLPVPFMAFEVFVGFIQAAIFALLTLFFVKVAMTPFQAH